MIGSFTIGKSASLSPRGVARVSANTTFLDTKKEFEDEESLGQEVVVSRAKLVIALPESLPHSDIPAAAISSGGGGGGGRGKSGELYRKLFSTNQRRVGAGGGVLGDHRVNGDVAGGNNSGVDHRPVLLRRRAQPLVEVDGGVSLLSNDNDAPLYSSVPIEDFGAAMLRGMGVTEEEIQAAEGEGDDDASSSQQQQAALSIPMPSLTRTKRDREHKGLGAASNPLLSSSSSSSSASSSSFKRAKATSRSLHSTLNGLSERKSARMSVGELAGRIVMVWQLDGVPGLQKMLVKTISVTNNAPSDTNEKEKEVNKQSLRTVVVGLREAVSVEESTLSVTEATHWKELVQLVAQEEEGALNEASKKAREEAKEQHDQAILSTKISIDSQEQEKQQRIPSAPFHNSSSSSSFSSFPPSQSSLSSSTPAISLSDNWLVRGISVRIADESWRGGAYFRKKGIVMDVVTPGICQLKISDNGEGRSNNRGGGEVLLEDVPQHILETALPKVGGLAIVIRGKKKGTVGTLIERKKDTETVVLRQDTSGGGSMLSGISFDDVAEYMVDL